ncbi:hypothetical protein BS47DRAFT_1383759 [Hydnum rufescens UP504]|uniref:Uncharacterized protein n=1 Tax=Hydnum rufescens UP504 TaxID=1448309 RepID=A0A9P6DUP1_9AGAM|nr:hypothetical protein BS47DRAFT_1383759 [Hydnum rufescens UP504]
MIYEASLTGARVHPMYKRHIVAALNRISLVVNIEFVSARKAIVTFDGNIDIIEMCLPTIFCVLRDGQPRDIVSLNSLDASTLIDGKGPLITPPPKAPPKAPPKHRSHITCTEAESSLWMHIKNTLFNRYAAIFGLGVFWGWIFTLGLGIRL